MELDPALPDGLAHLDGFCLLILLNVLHRTSGYKLRVKPFHDEEERGVFATRYPRRPNTNGLSVVGLLGREGPSGKSSMSTYSRVPLLDNKPYVPEFDARAVVRTGWLDPA